MTEIKFSYGSTTLVDILGDERSEKYLETATKTYHWATTWYFYGYTLISASAGVILLVLFLTNQDTLNRGFLTIDRIIAIIISTVPFTLFGLYLVVNSRRIRQAAKEQIDMFRSSLHHSQQGK